MRSGFEEQLAELNSELIMMGALCENAIAMSAKALLDGDMELAARAAELDSEIDRKERDIESLCMKLLLRQQPVASDLRMVSAALRMITDMERIGDQSADIAELAVYIAGHSGGQGGEIREMALATIRMVTDSVDAYVKRDTAMAKDVIAYDDVVDGLFGRIKSSLIDLIAMAPEDGEYALDLLMTAKYLERIGDHATNIAEWVLYSVTGRKE